MCVASVEQSFTIQDNVELTALCWLSWIWSVAKQPSYSRQHCPDPQSINKTTETYFLKPIFHK